MVQVYVDYSNNKITGYSTAVQAEAPAGDAIQVDDRCLNPLIYLTGFTILTGKSR